MPNMPFLMHDIKLVNSNVDGIRIQNTKLSLTKLFPSITDMPCVLRSLHFTSKEALSEALLVFLKGWPLKAGLD